MSRTELKGYQLETRQLLRLIDSEMDTFITSECYICGETATAKDDIPSDWGWAIGVETSILICDACSDEHNVKIRRP